MKAKRDMYKEVTDRIVAMMEKGGAKWVQQWTGGGFRRPLRHNGERYRGINVCLLWGAAEEKGYSQSRWMTFKQAKALGGCVRKGEKATTIIFFKKLRVKDRNDPQGEKMVDIPMIRAYSVFNVEQIDGLDAKYFDTPQYTNTDERDANAEAFFSSTGLNIQYGGGRACYSPIADQVRMPNFADFIGSEAFYSTLAHECIHATGHWSRLNREGITNFDGFGSPRYAFEELIAELGAAFTCADLGVSPEPREDHAAYLESWLRALKSDKKAIFKAASQAEAAAEHLAQMSAATHNDQTAQAA